MAIITEEEKKAIIEKLKQYINEKQIKFSALHEKFHFSYNHFTRVMRGRDPLTDTKYELFKAFLKKEKYL